MWSWSTGSKFREGRNPRPEMPGRVKEIWGIGVGRNCSQKLRQRDALSRLPREVSPEPPDDLGARAVTREMTKSACPGRVSWCRTWAGPQQCAEIPREAVLQARQQQRKAQKPLLCPCTSNNCCSVVLPQHVWCWWPEGREKKMDPVL